MSDDRSDLVRQDANTGAYPSCWRYLHALQAFAKDGGFWKFSFAASLRTAGHAGRGGFHVASDMHQSQNRRPRMNWIKALVYFWKGEAVAKEFNESRETIEDAKNVMKEAMACLDGEDGWLRKNSHKRTMCDDQS